MYSAFSPTPARHSERERKKSVSFGAWGEFLLCLECWHENQIGENCMSCVTEKTEEWESDAIMNGNGEKAHLKFNGERSLFVNGG
jgi:hypothetical protein